MNRTCVLCAALFVAVLGLVLVGGAIWRWRAIAAPGLLCGSGRWL